MFPSNEGLLGVTISLQFYIIMTSDYIYVTFASSSIAMQISLTNIVKSNIFLLKNKIRHINYLLHYYDFLHSIIGWGLFESNAKADPFSWKTRIFLKKISRAASSWKVYFGGYVVFPKGNTLCFVWYHAYFCMSYFCYTYTFSYLWTSICTTCHFHIFKLSFVSVFSLDFVVIIILPFCRILSPLLCLKLVAIW